MRGASPTQPSPVVEASLIDRPVRESDARPAAPLPHCGGEAVFLGRTRAEPSPDHGDLEALEYDAYRPMAERALAEIARSAAERFGCAFIGVRHSVGRVGIGEASVIVRAIAGHRGEAFDACRAVIDRLKAEAPIWKREIWSRGATWREDAPLGAGDGP